MQIHVNNILRFSWQEPAAGVVALLRVTPRQTDSQHCMNWRVDIDADGSLTRKTDAHGNLCHIFYADRAVENVEVEISGTVHTMASSGVETGTDEHLPSAVYARSTALTALTPAVRQFADGFRRTDRIETLHALMSGIHHGIAIAGAGGGAEAGADATLSSGEGRAEDLAHLFIAGARHLGYPAQFLSGHLLDTGRADSRHAWAQAYIEGLGWTHFDPTLNVSVSEAHLAVAVGLDSLDAMPARIASRNGVVESLVMGARGRENGQDIGQRQC